jgi:Glycosyl hydrolase catalytic core
MFRKLAGVCVCVTLCATLVVGAPQATASPHMLVGVLDQGTTFYFPENAFPILKKLRAQVLRVDLYWGGNDLAVAKRRPDLATDPNDPAYDWALYDRLATRAGQDGIKLLFTIWGTPKWANRGKQARYAPTNFADLRAFAFAAAKRYSGSFVGPDGKKLPAVRLWTAWNEPNQLFQLAPQYKRVRGKWVIQSAIDYAKICTAVYTGVHATHLAGERVACGVTAPRGNDNPTGSRGSPTPMSFMSALKKAGLKRFDAWAHNPYGGPREAPTTKPHSRGAVTLGNIDTMIKELTRLWGRKPVWLTEYAYQTNPPDKLFGVSYSQQARYLKQAFAIARKNPRIDMMLWFQIKDDTSLAGWQSGLMTARGKRKPAFTAFQRLPH